MKLRYAAVVLLFLAVPAQAAVYKCTNAAGTVEFKDKPCAPGAGGEIAVKGVEPARAAGEGNGGGGGGKKLEGRWCEYAVSLELDGEKDEGTPAEWNFIDDKVEYKVKGMQMPLKARLQQGEDGVFQVDHAMFGGAEAEWQIVQVRGNTAVMQSPIVGYYHLRKGGCP